MCNPNKNDRTNCTPSSVIAELQDNNDDNRLDTVGPDQSHNVPFPVRIWDSETVQVPETIDFQTQGPVIDTVQIPPFYIGPSVYDLIYGSMQDIAGQSVHPHPLENTGHIIEDGTQRQPVQDRLPDHNTTIIRSPSDVSMNRRTPPGSHSQENPPFPRATYDPS